MATTLKHLADHLNLSTAAVSMALNGKEGVSASTRARVLAAADELGYKPNRTGKLLRRGRTGSIGVYLPSTVLEYSLYYAEVTRGIVAALTETEFSPLLLPSAIETGDVRDFPAVDGFVIVEPHSDDLGMREILRGPTPTVCIDPPPLDAPPAWGIVESDTGPSVRASLDHMRKRGSLHPGLFTIESVSQWSRLVEEAYLGWCADNAVDPEVIHVSAAQSNDGIREEFSRVITGEPGGCDGLFVCGDGIAVRIAGVLRGMGQIVGESVQLVSGVDSTMMKFHTPPITSVDMDPFLYGQRAAHMLVDLIEAGERPSETVVERLPAPLVVRST